MRLGETDEVFLKVLAVLFGVVLVVQLESDDADDGARADHRPENAVDLGLNGQDMQRAAAESLDSLQRCGAG